MTNWDAWAICERMLRKTNPTTSTVAILSLHCSALILHRLVGFTFNNSCTDVLYVRPGNDGAFSVS
ncbi:MAG: hypothetical protein AAF224_03300 [Pseudomonadota bacterium]